MPRQPRFVFQNAFYHVFNRGINKQDIFLSAEDYQYFLKKLHNLKKKYDHSLYAFCLMPNHFHLSIQTRKTPISTIMSSLTTSYSMYFNRTHNHFGSVFQNRFKSILVDSDSYFLELSRYIYLNPVRAGLTKDPLTYPYSSVREAVGLEPLRFLDKDIVRLIGDSKESQNTYKQFISDGISEDLSEIEKLFENENNTIGSKRFATSAQRKYIRKRNKKR